MKRTAGGAKTNELNIYTIADLQRRVFLRGLPKVKIQGFGKFYELSLQALSGKTSTFMKYHRQAINMYLFRYGEIWVDKLKSSTAMSKLCCITNLIQLMKNEG